MKEHEIGVASPNIYGVGFLLLLLYQRIERVWFRERKSVRSLKGKREREKEGGKRWGVKFVFVFVLCWVFCEE